MKLYLNNASPYARLVLVAAIEKSLDAHIELVWTDPWASEQALLSVNPFSKVPALETAEETLIESACICQYLDDVGPGRKLLPAGGPARLAALAKYGQGRALIDGAFGAVIQRRFGNAAGGSEPALAERWLAATQRAIPVLEKGADRLSSSHPDIGDLSLAVGLAYLEFRLPEVGWRAQSPGLAAWYEEISNRRSMLQTAPR